MTHTPTLESATLFKGNGSVLVRFQFDGEVPRSDTFLIGLWGHSANGKTTRQFGLKFLDGERIAYFVFDHNAIKQTNWDDHVPTVDPNQVLVPYPSEHFDALGEGAELTAYVNVAGVDTQRSVPVEIVG